VPHLSRQAVVPVSGENDALKKVLKFFSTGAILKGEPDKKCAWEVPMNKIVPSSTFDLVEDDTHRKPRILVVDDDLAMRQYLTEALERRGYQVDTLPSGIQMTDVLEGSPPDLVILDVILPWKNGFDLCKAIKANQRWKNIPVVFLTAKRSDQDLAAGLRMGADGYLTKPVTIKELAEKVSSLLPR